MPYRTAAALVAVCLAAFAALAVDVTHDGAVARLDLRIAKWNAANMPGWLESTARPFSSGGGAIGMAVVGVAVAAWLAHRRRVVAALIVLVTYGVAEGTTVCLKEAFHRPRPDVGSAIPLPHSFSFPSGHALGAFATLTVAALLLGCSGRLLVTAALVLAALVAASRVILNVHYLSDVVAGACVGLSIALTAVCIDVVIGRKRSVRKGSIRPSPR
jgi:undecaprenyl-diphosphatase